MGRLQNNIRLWVLAKFHRTFHDMKWEKNTVLIDELVLKRKNYDFLLFPVLHRKKLSELSNSVNVLPIFREMDRGGQNYLFLIVYFVS